MTAPSPLVRIDDLKVDFDLPRQTVTVVDGVSLTIPRGKTLCLVGESGCGKSVTAKALLRLVENPGRIAGGSITLDREDGPVDIAALAPNDKLLRQIRGGEIALIHQEPMSFLSPLYTIGNQISEGLMLHRKVSKAEARRIGIETLREVGMPDPEAKFDRYTFQLSGGQRQRAMIAMALVSKPKLLIADEPTTALDVTTQANILDLLRRLQETEDMAVLFITHDLGVVEEIADEVAVMYLGKIVEQGPVDDVLSNPRHPYTRGLLASMPRLEGDFKAPLSAIRGMVPTPANRPKGCPFHTRCALAIEGVCDARMPAATMVESGHMVACHAADETAAPVSTPAIAAVPTPAAANARDDTPLLKVENLSKFFPIKAGFLERTVGHVRAVSDISFEIGHGETLGLVGESGCGKSTLAQTLIGIHRADAGKVTFAGREGPVDVLSARGGVAKALRSDMRMVFQDPSGSLNPRLRVRDIIGEVLEVNTSLSRGQIDARVKELLGEVGLSADYAGRYPHAFSGGQRQRVAIARALASDPRLVIADEAVSALDVSVQTQIINLMKRLQRQHGLTYLFVSHDLGVIANISDRVAVMYAGRIVEIGRTEDIFYRPQHPYTEALLAAIPGRSRRGVADKRIEGHAPADGASEQGCAFASRCPYAQPACRASVPALAQSVPGQNVACHRAAELDLSSPVRAA
ncbi:ABC transporter ATP-binding protein [Pelagibacterium sp. 26DY04]|uniref:ABC transporter ATP-binding protein n=1 Tax=Pelagibacterium sp. 26DY04 TaxID=2967130 RepID=UPI002814C599|nr:ABC transporter ATP-binding protein [Pelagibacterium sp. 26DY04]WMT88618.1 ABC transporter ATP-binding protein [Pelagibacterium sp. 26DY04]